MLLCNLLHPLERGRKGVVVVVDGSHPILPSEEERKDSVGTNISSTSSD